MDTQKMDRQVVVGQFEMAPLKWAAQQAGALLWLCVILFESGPIWAASGDEPVMRITSGQLVAEAAFPILTELVHIPNISENEGLEGRGLEMDLKQKAIAGAKRETLRDGMAFRRIEGLFRAGVFTREFNMNLVDHRWGRAIDGELHFADQYFSTIEFDGMRPRLAKNPRLIADDVGLSQMIEFNPSGQPQSQSKDGQEATGYCSPRFGFFASSPDEERTQSYCRRAIKRGVFIVSFWLSGLILVGFIMAWRKVP